MPLQSLDLQRHFDLLSRGEKILFSDYLADNQLLIFYYI